MWRKKFLESKILKEMQRSMVKFFLDIIILAELRNSDPVSGYDVMDFVHKKFGFLISPGTVYSVLYSMERKGLIKCAGIQTKRVYALNEKGAEKIDALSNSKEEIQRFMGVCIGG
jgi:DNA-binding PadR family transcriptional regulator